MPTPRCDVCRSSTGDHSRSGRNTPSPPPADRIRSGQMAPMADAPIDRLDHFRQDAALSHGELWLRYFELGGMSTWLQLEANFYGALEPNGHDHDVIAKTLNERFVELGGNHPLPYIED